MRRFSPTAGQRRRSSVGIRIRDLPNWGFCGSRRSVYGLGREERALDIRGCFVARHLGRNSVGVLVAGEGDRHASGLDHVRGLRLSRPGVRQALRTLASIPSIKETGTSGLHAMQRVVKLPRWGAAVAVQL